MTPTHYRASGMKQWYEAVIPLTVDKVHVFCRNKVKHSGHRHLGFVLSRVRFVSAQVSGRVLHVVRAVIHAEGALKSRSEQIERAHAECDVLHALPQGDLSPHAGAEPRKAALRPSVRRFMPPWLRREQAPPSMYGCMASFMSASELTGTNWPPSLETASLPISRGEDTLKEEGISASNVLGMT